MTKERQIYRCNVCGNIVGVFHAGSGQLVCCGKPMELVEEEVKDDCHDESCSCHEK